MAKVGTKRARIKNFGAATSIDEPNPAAMGETDGTPEGRSGLAYEERVSSALAHLEDMRPFIDELYAAFYEMLLEVRDQVLWMPRQGSEESLKKHAKRAAHAYAEVMHDRHLLECALSGTLLKRASE